MPNIQLNGLSEVLNALNTGKIKYTDLLQAINEGAQITRNYVKVGRGYAEIKATHVGQIAGDMARIWESGEKIHADGSKVVSKPRGTNGKTSPGKKPAGK